MPGPEESPTPEPVAAPRAPQPPEGVSPAGAAAAEPSDRVYMRLGEGDPVPTTRTQFERLWAKKGFTLVE